MPFDQILAKVGALILQAVPTLILIIVLHFYLKAMLFKPLAKVLAERDTLTKGAREKAESSLKLAEEKAAQYEKAIREARAELYKEQETMRKQWLTDQAAQVEQAKARGEATLRTAREQISKDASEARQSLLTQSEQLADQIANSIVG
jgi:F-type H+-transporting ATPase subunit b